jgi:hypothetical protein
MEAAPATETDDPGTSKPPDLLLPPPAPAPPPPSSSPTADGGGRSPYKPPNISSPKQKKPQEEQEQEEKNTNISPYSHTALTERFSTKTRNKFSEETEEGRRAEARARHRRCCEIKAREERERSG